MFDEGAKRESSWAAVARILVITLILSGVFIYYYFGPSVDEIQGNRPQASAHDFPIELVIAGKGFIIPENFTQFPRARRGGERSSVSLYAKMPQYTPYTLADKDIFDGNEPDSPIIHFRIEAYHLPFSEEERIESIFMKHIVDPEGKDGPAGLKQLDFRDDSGYSLKILLLGEDDAGDVVVFQCDKIRDHIPSPSCSRDMQMDKDVRLHYRFKRAHLNNWREIDRRIQALATSFATDPAPLGENTTTTQ